MELKFEANITLIWSFHLLKSWFLQLKANFYLITVKLFQQSNPVTAYDRKMHFLCNFTTAHKLHRRIELHPADNYSNGTELEPELLIKILNPVNSVPLVPQTVKNPSLFSKWSSPSVEGRNPLLIATHHSQLPCRDSYDSYPRAFGRAASCLPGVVRTAARALVRQDVEVDVRSHPAVVAKNPDLEFTKRL